MVKRIIVWTAVVAALGAAPAFAQPRIEVSATFGWIYSDGVEGNTIRAGDGNLYNRVDPKDSGSLGLGVGVLVSDNAEVGFMWGHQFSKLLLGGTAEREVGDLAVDTYHGYFGYNWGEHDAKIRPYFFGGLGATNFGSVNFTRAAIGGGTVSGSTSGETQFSTTWGAGVKGFPSPRVGYRIGAQWTPTYIKSDSVGYWCDPYWGCYLVGDPQYSNQFGINGGVVLRF